MVIYNRKDLGLFNNGCFQDGTNRNFSSYDTYKLDSFSGDTCIGIVTKEVYGSGYLGDEFIEVFPEKYYQLSCSARTLERNYLGTLAGGHIGYACYNKDKVFIGHNQAFSVENTVLTRPASAGDTVIYIGRGDWSNSTTGHMRSINFYPFGTEFEGNEGGYTTYNMSGGNGGYLLGGISQVSGSEWAVSLSYSIPSWSGISLVQGTVLGRTWAGASYNYVLGAPNHPETWTIYTSGIISGYQRDAGTNASKFRDRTKYIKFLNLVNYNNRLENQGPCPKYLLDNIIFVECRGNKTYSPTLFTRNQK